MEKLVSEGSKDRPVINFDKESGILFLGGSSLPENVLEVYKPVLKWLNTYIADPNPITTIDFFFEYLNTASSRMIMQILQKCLELNKICEHLEINWRYIAGDVDMRDFGQELMELTNFPINIISKDTHIRFS
jgi:hypothetical protein